MLEALNENEIGYDSSMSAILNPLTPARSLTPTIRNALIEGNRLYRCGASTSTRCS